MFHFGIMSSLRFPDGSVGKESFCNVGGLVQALGWEDPLEKDMASHSSTLAWEIPWTEEPAGVQSMGSQERDMTEQLSHQC